MTVTCDTPGVASSRRRTSTSAVVRRSSGDGGEAAAAASGARATNKISPMIDVSGASTGGSMPSGSVAATPASFSTTVCRAR